MANLDTAVVGQRQRLPLHALRRRHLDDGQVGLRVGRHDFGARPHAIVEVDDDLLGILDHVVVGDDVTLVVIDEAGALATLERCVTFGHLRQLEARNLRKLYGRRRAFHLDVDDRRRDSFVQSSQRVLVFIQRRVDLQGRCGNLGTGAVRGDVDGLPGKRCGQGAKDDQPGASNG